MKKAKFLILSHGRVATASTLEAFQYFPNIFLPSYWHADSILQFGTLQHFFNYKERYSSQVTIPSEVQNLEIGLINHNFPINPKTAEIIANRSELFLHKTSKIFIYERNFEDNFTSSYKAYLDTWFCFHFSNGKLIPPKAFKTLSPLGIKDFFQQYGCLINTDFHKNLYRRLGYEVYTRKFEDLNCLDSETKFILKTSDIAFDKNITIPKISYRSNDCWPIQTSFSFQNKFIIGGWPLTVGYFNPFRAHPNQGTLDYEIYKNVYVGMDQWFLLPQKYKEAIKSCTDPWGVVEKTIKDYESYKLKVQSNSNFVYSNEVNGINLEWLRKMFKSFEMST